MPRWSLWFVRCSLVFLVVGVSIGGVALALPGLVPGSWILAHIELLLVGWFAHLAFGVASWILPKARKPQPHASVLAWASFGLLSLGTIAAVCLTVVGERDYVPVARVAQFVACLAFGLHIRPRIRAFGEL